MKRILLALCCGLHLLAQAPELVVQAGHSAALSALAFSPDSQRLATASHDRTLILWDLATRSQLRTFQGHTHKVSSVAYGKTLLASGGFDGTARLWNPATGRLLRTISAHGLAVDAVALTADERMLATASFDTTVKVWDPSNGTLRHTLSGHRGGVAAVAFSPDGRLLASGSHDHDVRLWDPATGALLRTLQGHPVAVMGLAFNADGRFLASAGGGIAGRAEVFVWDVRTGEAVRHFVTDDEWISSVAFSRDGGILVGGSNTKGRALHRWDLRTGQDLGKLPTRSPSLNALAYSPDGAWLALGSSSGAVELRSPKDGTDLGSLEGQVHALAAVAWSPDGQQLALGGSSPDIDLWGLSGTATRLSGHTGDLNGLAFSPDSGRLASASYDQTVRIWDLVGGRAPLVLKGHASYVKAVAWSPDGTRLASGSWDTTARLWDAATGRELRVFRGHLDFVRDVAFSPDGRMLATASGDTTVKLWDVDTGALLATLEGHTNWVEAVAFSPDGRLLASGSVDRTLKLWDVASRQELRTLAGHGAAVTGLVFLHEGTVLASASFDQTLRVWDVATGRETRVLRGATDAVQALAKGWDDHLASAGKDAQVRFWDPGAGSPLASLVLLGSGDWAAADPAGRFDTNTLEEVRALRWVTADDPYRPLPVEIFLRDYYEPRLVPRLLRGESFAPLADLQALNPAQPRVRILDVQTRGDRATVALEVERGRDRTRTSDAYDLRLFRDGQLVGVSAQRSAPGAGDSLLAWRRVHRLRTDPGTGKARLVFTGLRLPQAAEAVTFSAYAFNEDRVKSATARTTVPLTPRPGARGRAYLLTVGVNDSDHPAWRLQYAANDARRLRKALVERLARNPAFGEVVAVTLVSPPEAGEGRALKAHVKAVLDLLAGRPVPASLRGKIPGVERLLPATPEDLVLIAYSGHGTTGPRGVFYLLPEDVGRPRSEAELIPRCLSSDELSEWLRDVDAGDLALVVDACHSAASVQGEGFKPGPMGSRGLGQLAFDKGMRILASSQADTAALESEALRQGLLSYALVQDGFERKAADFLPKDGAIALSEWLAYSTRRVPALAEDVLRNRLPGVRGIRIVTETSPTRVLQQPALFDFRRRSTDIQLEGP